MKNLLFACACVLATSAMAQATFPITLTTADGLPEQTSEAAANFNGWTSPTYTFAEPVSSFRMTVTHTSWQDAFSTSNNGSRGYVFFTLGEFYLYDGDGNKVALTASNFTTNAAEAAATGDGAGLAGLCDGDENTHFHTTYNTPEEGSPNPIGQEFYLEITFPEPMTSFAFGFQKRNNSANIPSEIILTAGGVEANPFPEYEFQLGEEVAPEDVKMGEMYVLCDNGSVSKYEGTYLYPATNGVPGYNSEAGVNGYHLRRTPNVDCIFVPVFAEIDAEGNQYFYLRNYLTGKYLTNNINWHEPTSDINQAAKLRYFIAENGRPLLVSNTEVYYATNSQASFVAFQGYKSSRKGFFFHKATIAASFLFEDLQAVIADAEAQLAAKKDVYTEAGANEDVTKFQAAIAEAKAVATTATGEEINAAKVALESATTQFLTTQIYLWSDEVAEILTNTEFGANFGNYPVAQQKILQDLQKQLTNDIDTRSFTDLNDVKNYIANVQKILDEFYASKIESYSEWPAHIIAPEGTRGLGVLTNYPDLSEHNNKYVYNSPTFVLQEPIDRFYLTIVHTINGDNGGGWECTAFANLAVYDQDGKEIQLLPGDFSTNAQEPSCPIERICDKNEDGSPDLLSYFHSLWSSKDVSTNEHWVCVELPQSLSCFSFQYITRDNGLAPTDIVVGPEPYHYVDPASIGLRDMITSAADIDPNKYYLLKGNINVVDQGQPGSGFYSSATSAGEYPQNEGAIQFIPTGDDGGYNIYFPVLGYYLAQPTDWQGVVTTTSAEAAGIWHVVESKNLQDAFKIYAEGPFGSDGFPYAVLQDWSGSLGYYTINYFYKEDFDDSESGRVDDTDGEGDWTIYECDAPVYNVELAPISKTSQLNTTDQFAMWGNLEVVSKGGEGSGFYNAVTLDGKTATNWNLFRLEEAEGGAYKIFFTAAQVYLKAPAGWASMQTTTNTDEAGAFLFKESENLKDAFKIYATGDWNDNGACPIAVIQDWGDGSNMGSYTIPDWASDDTDGESDWTIFTTGDPGDIDERIISTIKEGAVISTVIYNINGQVMEAPAQGINIVKTIYDNGTVLVQKILVK